MGDNFKIYIKEIGQEAVNWILVAQNMVQCRALVDAIMNF
jgi:hypothetical protein